MPAAAIALEAYQGEDYAADGTHRLTADPTAAVVDISGWTIVFTVRRRATDPEPVLGPIACTLVAPTAGTYTVVLSAAQTGALGIGDYACDVWRTNAGAATELAIGRFTILQPVRSSGD